MMTERGHRVYHYGVEGSNPICTENVVVVSNEVYNRVYGDHDYRSNFFKYDINDECYQTFFKNTIKEIRKRNYNKDIVLPFWGSWVKPICDALQNECIIIEPGIGYGSGSWADFKVFESYSIYSAYCGTDSIDYCQQNYYHVVIPNYFDPEDFSVNLNPRNQNPNDRYFLYLGRVYDGKGVHIAIQICEKLGVKLKIAGQLGTEYAQYEWPKNIEFVGYADRDKRNELMRNAIASFLPSQYLEPFGGVQIENLLCGTPTITSDWGAFAENNIHGITGYRCRTFDNYLNAAIDCLEGKIDPQNCYKQGLKFTLEQIAPQYERFFNDVRNLYFGEGWKQISPQTQNRIDNLNK
jgi:glycosyltransferase involved in cell wall biosynthesis